ncbi:DUF488 family protein, N3 subclade [Parageobacillus thermoglucosidasius]|uniref:DUF488 family protein, N3 subclade n=1 Tax=Parageobacillus thermoglucosidasius TaxID=1426 RepID=UPI0027F7C237|nr:hypothetical protein PthstB1num2_19020 [Parageobacillus thermoglucosidasius]
MKKPRGKLYTSNVDGLKFAPPHAEVWQITRAGHDISGAIVVRSLSPSPQLFQRYLKEWKGTNPKKWWPLYENVFLSELREEEKLKSLRDIYKKLLLGQDIVLLCFCADHRYCHRRLVGEFFKPYGVVAVELNPIKIEQLSLF